jgi:hypothetical protein
MFKIKSGLLASRNNKNQFGDDIITEILYITVTTESIFPILSLLF